MEGDTQITQCYGLNFVSSSPPALPHPKNIYIDNLTLLGLYFEIWFLER